MSRFAQDARALKRAEFETLQAYWADPAPFEAERAREQAKLNAMIDARTRANHPHIGGDDDAA